MSGLGDLLGQQRLDPVGVPPGGLDAEPDAELHVVELRMPSGLWYTLRLPGWDEVEGESAPVLTHDGELYVFRSPRDLLDWCAEATEHELATSGAWEHRTLLRAEAHDDDRFDLVSGVVPDDGPVEREQLPALMRVAQLLDDIVVGLDLDAPAVDALDASDEYADLLEGGEHLDGLLDGGRRERLADALRESWDVVVRMVDQRLREPELPAGAAASASPSGDVAGGGPGAPAVARPLEDVAPVETVWLGLAELDIFTLRRIPEADADPAYLGGAGTLVGATDLDRLRAWLSLREPNDLSELPGWDDLGDADDVDLEPYEDAVLEIAELGDLFTTDLDRTGAEQLVGAWVALAELAQWGGWTDVLAELEADRPVGHVLSGVLPEVSAGDSRGRRRLQELDLDEVQECWAAIVALVESRVRLVD